MPIFSRRSWLTAGAGLGLAVLLSACASAPTAVVPTATKPAPGVARVDLGGVTVTTLSDGVAVRPLDAGFVRNAPLADVQQALRDANLPTDKVEIPFVPLVVDMGGQRVLLDAGNGEFGAATAGKLLESMARAGIAPASITAVVISHFHGDHINGLRNKAGELVFPNARIHVPAPEWDWWMDDARMNAAPENARGGFNNARRVFGPIAGSVVKFQPGQEVLPGLRSMAAFGHTAGHTVFTIAGSQRTLLYWGDTANVAALFVRNPEWAVAFDQDAEAARKVRRQLADMAVEQNLLVAGYHLPGSAIGTLTRRGNGYEFTPL
jgi:glyoxylase-like metal-dependent hydrolase (beta-lactamase superfamily II)